MKSHLAPGCPGYHRQADRREFLQVGALGPLGLTMSGLLQARATAAAQGVAAPKREVSCIMIWLRGGPSSIDMWDLKPGAPDTHRGEFKPISTNVPGIQISDQLPLTAQQADKFCLVRSVTHPRNDHEGGSHYMATGWNTFPVEKYPSYGCVTAHQLGPRGALPAHVHLPEGALYTGPGYLGSAHEPFTITTDRNPDLPSRDLQEHAVLLARMERRRTLRQSVDDLFRQADVANEARSVGKFYRDAYSILASPATRAAFDLTKESPAVRARYGMPKPLDNIVLQNGNDISPNDFNRTIIGQGMLLARRLIESGVRFVTVVGRGWDTHDNNFNRLRDLLPPLDRGLAALLADLKERGLLDTTLVMVTGDFNRTPRINPAAGRDHWGHVQTVWLAGGGIRGGAVFGASDAKGEFPSDQPVRPEQIAALLFRQLGINTSSVLASPDGRPHALVQGEAQPLTQILG